MSESGDHGIRSALVLMTCLLVVTGCSTQTYYREDGAKVTVEKFAGIPYLEKEEKTRVVPAGAEYEPTE
ncbi:MAG TPA: hypothetical protein VET88_16245 [Gammaproteobacteria bacterium]|nr:hypothetical protein [Gammaproteobacteria bacterium]